MEKKTKKILLVTRPLSPPWDEGSKNFAFSLANHVNDLDLEMHALTNGEVRDLGPAVCQRQIFSSNSLGILQKGRLLSFLKKNAAEFDIIHLIFTPTKINSFFLKIALAKYSGKVIQTLATLREDLYSPLDLKKMLFGDLVITYSDYAKSKLKVLEMENIERIFPGIDIEKYAPKPANFELAKRFDIRSNDFVINFSGEYTRMGAMDDVVETFIDLSNERANFKLLLAVRIKNSSDAKRKSEVTRRFSEAGVLERIIFADDQKYKMEDVYNLASISIFPVRDMAGKFDIPLAVIEAMACGKPMIATDIERIRYFLNEKNSLLIHPGKTFELREKILDLYDNPRKAELLGEWGMKFVRENFDIRNVARKYAEIYKRL